MCGCVHVWVCAYVGFVMCGCFDNCVGILIIFVLVFIVFVLCFVLFRLCISLFILSLLV